MKTFRSFVSGLLLLSLVSFLGCQIEKAPFKSLGGFGKVVSSDLQRTDTVRVESKQNVLVEDFTGWKCGNCPQASEVVTKLKKTYGPRIIAAKIHVTEIFAQPDGHYQIEDFRTPVGNDIFNFAKGQALPNGMVNRKLSGGKQLVYYTEWEKMALEDMEKSPSALIKIHNMVVEGADGKVSANSQIQLNYLNNGSLEDKIALYLTEDSVIGTQVDYRLTEPYEENYPHTEVFRGAVTGAWGEEIRIFASEARNEAPKANQKIGILYTFDLNPKWKTKNLSLIAVLYDDKTKQVIQVAKKSFKNIK